VKERSREDKTVEDADEVHHNPHIARLQLGKGEKGAQKLVCQA